MGVFESVGYVTWPGVDVVGHVIIRIKSADQQQHVLVNLLNKCFYSFIENEEAYIIVNFHSIRLWPRIIMSEFGSTVVIFKLIYDANWSFFSM